MRTTVRLPEELLRKAKRKAAADGVTLTALIEEGLRSVVAERPAGGKRRPVKLPVSKARGGLRPGLVWERLYQQGQELEDAEYAARLDRAK